ncbi:GTP cyclohydrolase II RibA [Microvirga aerophila]|uniref:GTP cyclohydrolase II n=1 Tax=Microvirga aerophila TaxID=670291 RepID=A0A512BSV0_9HYPH|nr:GTP cyclohydrolase II RibA [Microvirga aerophila]GEO14985.1 GTP cyclohydrolase-2 [Microvirga aerophila]
MFADPTCVNVERAISDVRAGRPVLVQAGGDMVLAIAVEGLDQRMADALADVTDGCARLLLTSARLRYLGLDRTAPGSVPMPVIDLDRLGHLALRINGRIDAPVGPVSYLDEAALELAQLSLVLPAMLAIPLAPPCTALQNLLSVPAEEVHAYRRRRIEHLRIVSRAPVPLDGAYETEFVVFRGGEGLRDQVAILVKAPNPAGAVDVRIHSACLTGDLFGSLKCECGDQLRHTVKQMAEGEGGILLYLDQEGRGNGIGNKMQSQGYDTYDADEALGFEADHRSFDFAAVMLRQLGVETVRVLTNNPSKIAALREAGLAVVSERRVLGRPTAENVRYLASKRDRAGHKIDFDLLAVHAPLND